jgi:hypothetical protein
MSTQKIIKELLDENLIGAKKEIEDILYAKLGEKLTEAYKEIAPTIITDDVDETGGEMKAEYAKSDKGHGCANVVEHPEWGEGKCITEMHAEPDDNGFVEWYDVEFEHGIERQVPVSEMKVLEEAYHTHGGKKKKKMNEDSDVIEEEKHKSKKQDHDGDGDGDFADIMMARMIKSGMSKEEAMKKTRKHNKGAAKGSARNSGSEGY